MGEYKDRSTELSSGTVMSALHLLHDRPNWFLWLELKWGFEYIYCEERLYFIRYKETGAMYLVEGKSPNDAVERLCQRLENLGGDL